MVCSFIYKRMVLVGQILWEVAHIDFLRLAILAYVYPEKNKVRDRTGIAYNSLLLDRCVKGDASVTEYVTSIVNDYMLPSSAFVFEVRIYRTQCLNQTRYIHTFW